MSNTPADDVKAKMLAALEAKKNKKGAIIIEDENTGALCFARYGKNV